MDTVAGPGFCAGPTEPDPASSSVGGVAADPGGTLWFASGPPGEGLVTHVLNSTRVDVIRTRVESLDHPRPEAGETASPRPASASVMAPDQAGGLLIAVPTAVVRFADEVSTVAGAVPLAGATDAPERQRGDGGPARDAGFNRIVAIATDDAGNVYVADELEHDTAAVTVRFVNRSDEPVTFYPGTAHELVVAPGMIDTIAGRRGGPVETLVAREPVLAAASGRLYVAATAPGPRPRAVVQVLNLGGGDLSAHGVTVAPSKTATVTTVTGATDTAGVGQSSASALPGITADDQGNLFLAEQTNHRVTRMDAAGVVTTFAGTGAAGFNGNDQPAMEARLDGPYDVEIGGGGRVFISDAGNAQVRVVDPSGNIRAALGNGAANRWVCTDATGGAGAADGGTRYGEPVGVAADDAGNVYVAAAALGQVQRLAPSGSLRPVAGRLLASCDPLLGCPAGDDASPDGAFLPSLTAIAPGPDGGLYVMEQTRVRFFNLASRPVRVHAVLVPAGGMRTVSGSPPTEEAPPPPLSPAPPTGPPSVPSPPAELPPATADGESAVTADPGVRYTEVTGDGGGDLLLADVPQGGLFIGYGSIRQVDDGGAITTLVERPGKRADGSADATRCCAYPGGLATDAAGNLYIADSVGKRVWFVNRDSASVVAHGVYVAPGDLEPVAGSVTGGSEEEGIPALQAQLATPRSLAVDGSGNLYVVDFKRHSVLRIDDQGTITTVMGTGQAGFNGDGLDGRLTALNEPSGLAIDACGNLLVADAGNDRVRRLNLVASCPGVDRAPIPAGSGGLPAVGALGVGAVVMFTAVVGTGVALWRRRGHASPLEGAGSHGS